jgi:sirohydrochlorin cobaltochelatase
MSEGLILFAHGARDPRWAEPFQAVATRVREQCPGVHVRVAFLDFMQPTLAEAAEELAALGSSHVAVQPMFLGTGGHVRQDLPRLMEQIRAKHSGTTWSLHTAIGETGAVIEAMAGVAAGTLARRP